VLYIEKSSDIRKQVAPKSAIASDNMYVRSFLDICDKKKGVVFRKALIVGNVIDINDLYDARDFCSFDCSGLSTYASEKSVDRATKLPRSEN